MSFQNRLRNFQKSDLWRDNDVIIKNNGKILTSAKPDKWYIVRKVLMRELSENLTFIAIERLNQVMAIQVKFWPIFVNFTMASH